MGLIALSALVGIVALAFVFGRRRSSAVAKFADMAEVARQWTRHHPLEVVDVVILSEVRTAALVETDRGSGLMCHASGALLCYALAPAGLRYVGEHPRGLRIGFDEGDAILDLTGAEAATWTAYLSRFVTR